MKIIIEKTKINSFSMSQYILSLIFTGEIDWISKSGIIFQGRASTQPQNPTLTHMGQNIYSYNAFPRYIIAHNKILYSSRHLEYRDDLKVIKLIAQSKLFDYRIIEVNSNLKYKTYLNVDIKTHGETLDVNNLLITLE